MFERRLTKPDGRHLILYARDAHGPIPGTIAAPSPKGEGVTPRSHLRFHPLRGEWVAYASHRQNRTFLPPPEYNPLAPSSSVDAPTELPEGAYEAAVFDNLFPTLSPQPGEPPAGLSVPVRLGYGACEVVVFTQDPRGSLGQLPLDRIELVFEIWAQRTAELGARKGIEYVMPFENRGVEVGVTLQHPHGQIYAYPIVPPLPARELEEARRYFDMTGLSLLGAMIDNEVKDGTRMLYEGPHVVAFVPICARYSYEVWIAPRAAVGRLDQLSEAQRADFARALKTILRKYDLLWKRPFPYLMAFHQGPTDDKQHPYAHMHLEFSPPLRSPTKLKYLAGTELGAGLFAADSLPEEKAAELRAVPVDFA
ncbi:MAG: galactose-1-phosphate uridylyltransferase [Polyangiaceae bacterium]